MKSFFKALNHRITVAYADDCGEDPFIFCINNARYNDSETHDASIPYFRLHNVEKGGCDLVDLIFFFRKGNLIPEGDLIIRRDQGNIQARSPPADNRH